MLKTENISNMTPQSEIPWEQVVKKEARCLDEYDLGEVQEVHSDFILTQKGLIDKKWFKIPRTLVHEFDGTKLYFACTYQEANEYTEAADEENNE
jgi:hypothetical protein